MAQPAEHSPSALVGEGEFPVTLTHTPASIVLGEAERVVFRVAAPEPEGPQRPLRASVNVGDLGEVRRLDPGVYEIPYQPPVKKYPQVAILAVWRETGPEAPVAFFRVPLAGTARVPVETKARASVMVDVGGQMFGPFEADRRGKAVLKLAVPPGVKQATIIATDPTAGKTTAKLDLDVPPYNRLTMAVVPHSLVADGRSRARVHVYYDAVGGKSPRPQDVDVDVPLGRVQRVRRMAPTLYSAEYLSPPPGTPDQKMPFSVRVAGDTVSLADAALSLGSQVPASVQVHVRPERVLADGTEAPEVEVTVLDAFGLGVPGVDVAVEVEADAQGGQPRAVSPAGQGKYLAALTPLRLAPEVRRDVTATVRARVGTLTGEGAFEVAPWLPHTLAVTPEEIRIVADGTATVVLTAVVKDERGRPIPGLQPRGSATRGTVSDAVPVEGGYQLRYSAPRIEEAVLGASMARAEPREATVTLRVDALESTTRVSLTPEVRVVGRYRAFLEVTGGYRGNLGPLSGPTVGVSVGANLINSGRVLASLGLTSSFSDQRGTLGFVNSLGESADGRARLFPVPAFGEARLSVRGARWIVSLGGGGGVVFVPGALRVAGSGDLSLDTWTWGYGARLLFGYSVGFGKLILDASWLGADLTDYRQPVDATGPVGGLGVGLGFRVEL